MNKRKAASFESVASIYARIRPGYAEAVYQEIETHKILSANSVLLEIGAGHGVATKEIAGRWSPTIIAVEPGKNLCKAMQERTGKNPKVTIENTTFEAYEKS
ncbi:rRNA adenine N-6-methyltransferase family protein [Marispirochaeta sp.]|uniref:rRNA adenine N-6-methyltransferase family protein n=1 Tax=Marispirochaeta sp. TaxID=2038653 RepID=UPI0029C71E2B|nr:rRNA adenine N-6-methyltransferase family protein [Marispirochaeta sp.]